MVLIQTAYGHPVTLREVRQFPVHRPRMTHLQVNYTFHRHVASYILCSTRLDDEQYDVEAPIVQDEYLVKMESIGFTGKYLCHYRSRL